MNNKKISQSKNQLKMLKKPVLTNKLSPDMFVVTVVDSIASSNGVSLYRSAHAKYYFYRKTTHLDSLRERKI